LGSRFFWIGKTDTRQKEGDQSEETGRKRNYLYQDLPIFSFRLKDWKLSESEDLDRKFLLQGGLGMRRQMADVNAWKPKSKLLRIHTSQDKGSQGGQGGKGPLP
jgi:hypothetical protein